MNSYYFVLSYLTYVCTEIHGVYAKRQNMVINNTIYSNIVVIHTSLIYNTYFGRIGFRSSYPNVGYVSWRSVKLNSDRHTVKLWGKSCVRKHSSQIIFMGLSSLLRANTHSNFHTHTHTHAYSHFSLKKTHTHTHSHTHIHTHTFLNGSTLFFCDNCFLKRNGSTR